MYLAQTLKDRTVEKEESVYGSKKIDLPKPEFYVVYTGGKNVNDVYSLSEEFLDGDGSFIDIRVRILKADEGSKDIITQYITFTKILDDQIRKSGRTREAVEETIRICRNEDILREYLSKREKEVIGIMTTLFSQEEATRMYGRQLKREAAAETQKETAERMIRDGALPDEKIALYSGLTLSQAKALREEMKTAVMA